MAAAAALTLAAACASNTSRTMAGGVSPDANLITADEIAKAEVRNAYDAIQKLRPAMLTQGARRSSSVRARNQRVVVYVDNAELGGADQLRQIPALSIATIRFFTPSEAQLRWGRGHLGGAIEVLTRR